MYFIKSEIFSLSNENPLRRPPCSDFELSNRLASGRFRLERGTVCFEDCAKGYIEIGNDLKFS